MVTDEKNNDFEITGEDEAGEARVYELGFHIDPDKSEKDTQNIFDSIKQTAEKAGSIIAIGAPHKITLAYTISRMSPKGREDFNGSYFAWLAYEAGVAGHDAVLEKVKKENAIFRFLDIKTTKEEAKLGEELHNARMESAQAKPEEEKEVDAEAIDMELDAVLKEAGV